MTKQKAEQIDPIIFNPNTEFFVKQETMGIYKGCWIIYSKTKWGHKTFNVYDTKDQALKAIDYFDLNLITEEL